LDISHVLSIHKNQHEAVLPNALQNGSISAREAAPPEKPEPELFLVEPEPCQTGPKIWFLVFTVFGTSELFCETESELLLVGGAGRRQCGVHPTFF